MINIEVLKELVEVVTFDIIKYIEDDDSVTLSLNGFEIIVNDIDEDKAMSLLIMDLREYSLEYMGELDFWGNDINRREKLKGILKVILTKEDNELKKSFRYLDIR